MRWIVAVLVLVLAAAAVGVALWRNGDVPCATQRGLTMTEYLKLPGDQVVVVPNGTYVGADVTAPHESTNGSNGGWLVLQAESPGGVIVDLSPPGQRLPGGLVAQGDLVLAAGTSRVMFVGFSFVNGSVRVAGDNIQFRYTDHSYPATVWGQEPNYPHRDDTPMYHPAPRTLYLEARTRGVGIFGSHFHDTGTAISLGADVADVTIQGVTITNLSDGAPELDPYDVIHPDGIGMVGGAVRTTTIRDSWIKVGRSPSTSGIVLGDRQGPIPDLLLQDLWVSSTTGGGLNFFSATVDGLTRSGRGLFGRIESVRAWDNGWDRADTIDGVTKTRPNWNPTRINLPMSNFVQSAPDPGSIDPATAWRVANPYVQVCSSLEEVVRWRTPPTLGQPLARLPR